MSNPTFDPHTSVAFDELLTPQQIVQRDSENWHASHDRYMTETRTRNGILMQIRALEANFDAVRASLVAARSDLVASEQRLAQYDREARFAYARAVKHSPPPLADSPAFAPPSQAFAQPGGALDQEKARAGLPATLTLAQINEAQNEETLRLLAITREQIARRNSPVEVTVVAPAPPAEEK
jgi:hypothetical protein